MRPNSWAVLACLLLSWLLLWASSARAEVAASVHFVSGQVTAQAAGQGARALAKGGEILGQDRVETAADGRIQMRFTDGGLVSLMPNTVFSVEEYRLGSGAADEGSLVFNMVRGGLRTVTGSIGKTRNENYQLKTPVGTLGIRGTEFIAVLNPPNTLRVHVGRGRVAISNDHGAIEVPAGQSAVVTQGSAPQTTDEQPVFLASAPGSASGAAAQGQDAGTGRVDRDPYVVLVSYDLPVAAERQVADAGQGPQPSPEPAPQPAPQPVPQPPAPEPPAPEPEPPVPEPPVPEPPVPPAPEPPPTPEPPEPPVPPPPGPNPNPPSPVAYTSGPGEYGAFLFGDIVGGGEVATFDVNGVLLSFGTAMEDGNWTVGTQYNTDRSVTVDGNTVTVPDIAIGQFAKAPAAAGFSQPSGGITGFSAVAPVEKDYAFFAIGAGELSAPTSGYLRYSLTSTVRQVGRIESNGLTDEARLRSFELQLKNLGAVPTYDLSMAVSKQAPVAGDLIYSVEQRNAELVFPDDKTFLASIPDNIERRPLGGNPEGCTGCWLMLSGVFGTSSAQLGIAYTLEDGAKNTEISGAALLGQVYASRASGDYFIAKSAPSGVASTVETTLAFDQFLGGLQLDSSLMSVLGESLDLKGEIRLAAPAPEGGFQWESSILIGEYKDYTIPSNPSYLPFAIGSGLTGVPNGGELRYSLLSGAPAGRRGIEETSPAAALQRFDLVLHGLDAAGSEKFDLDMAIAASVAAGSTDVLHPGYQVSQTNGSLDSLGIGQNNMLQHFGFSVDGGSIQRESVTQGNIATCGSGCSMDVRGVFGHPAAAAVVYRLMDHDAGGLVQGAAMLGPQ